MTAPNRSSFARLNRYGAIFNHPQIDSSTSSTMIYITNYELRDYQLQMAKSAIHKNTLICIPTGLGKTFIGAVLIANYHRWYPNGKIIFATPSRPLLIQQMNAIRDILQLNNTEYTEISGSVGPTKRISKWQNHSIFFGTPQAIQNDIDAGIVDCSSIILVILDEAHRAQGDYSYCKIISSISSITPYFRIVGLTATPGQNFIDIQQLINNLRIETIESDTCTKYSHKRKISKIIIPKNPGFETIQMKLNSLLVPLLTSLNRKGICQIDDPEKLTKGSVAIMSKQNQSYEFYKIIRLLGLRERLEDYSIDIFEKSVLEDGGKDLSFLLNITSKLPHDDIKMNKLLEIVLNYISNENQQIIIFCNYRLVVSEIVNNLRKHKVKCEAFIGQSNSKSSKGINRSKQIQIMNLFKQKVIDVLVSTSIGEEGLDIGEVGLIICYDIPKSLTRMIQRIGRTGRKQDGQVIFLRNETSKSNYLIANDKLFENESNYFESISNTFIQCNKENFEMFDNQVKLVPDDLNIIYKKIDQNNEICLLNQSNRCYLTENEKYELELKFGSKLLYHQFDLKFEIQKNKFYSNESCILMNLNHKNTYFEISSIEENENESSDSESLSFPLIKPVNNSFLRKSEPSFEIDSPISFIQRHSNKTHPSIKLHNIPIIKENQINNENIYLNKTSDIINSINYKIHNIPIIKENQINSEYSINEKNHIEELNNDHLNSIKDDVFVMESESFISESSEIICSSSDEFDLKNSHTFLPY